MHFAGGTIAEQTTCFIRAQAARRLHSYEKAPGADTGDDSKLPHRGKCQGPSWQANILCKGCEIVSIELVVVWQLARMESLSSLFLEAAHESFPYPQPPFAPTSIRRYRPGWTDFRSYKRLVILDAHAHVD